MRLYLKKDFTKRNGRIIKKGQYYNRADITADFFKQLVEGGFIDDPGVVKPKPKANKKFVPKSEDEFIGTESKDNPDGE